MVALDHFDRVLRFDPDRGTITCQGGISIAAVCQYLEERGFALRYCGNYGKQTLAGALATGTHGYGREGGLMSELVRAVTLLLPDGRRIHTSEERDLRALRLSLGALGVVLEVTLAVERTGPCRYQAAAMPREEFASRLDELAGAHDSLRFSPHPFDARAVFYVTIDRQPDGGPTQPASYINDASPGAARLLVPWLRMPPVRELLGRTLRLGQRGYSLRVPFSSLLFVSSGVVVGRHAGLARASQLALEQHGWLNMELAVPRARYADFERLFAEERPRLSRASRRQPYYTCRVVGAARNVLLAPNYDRDVVFCDIHAHPAEPSSLPFLRRLEAASGAMSARPHWGKVFFAERPALDALYPAANLAAFAAAKRRFDPEGVFSNDYTRRVLGM
jgi:L-gulonolactone oxidase